jgi:hypothetical protein
MTYVYPAPVERTRIQYIPVSANVSIANRDPTDTGFPYQLLITAAAIVMLCGLVLLALLGTISFTRHRSLGRSAL